MLTAMIVPPLTVTSVQDGRRTFSPGKGADFRRFQPIRLRKRRIRGEFKRPGFENGGLNAGGGWNQAEKIEACPAIAGQAGENPYDEVQPRTALYTRSSRMEPRIRTVERFTRRSPVSTIGRTDDFARTADAAATAGHRRGCRSCRAG